MEIEEIFERLFGNIAPVGSTHIDDERVKNIPNYHKALNFIINELREASKYKDEPMWSMQEIGKKCYDILKEFGLEED
jgi:hypothetical protein